MGDVLVTGLLKGIDLRVLVVIATDAAREARRRHQLAPASATMMAHGLAAGALLAALQKEQTRVNLQLECDGPLRGMFIDASSGGEVRGYVKNTAVDVESHDPAFRFRPALGNSGYLSVLRDLNQGEFYRSSVELKHLDLARDLETYFAASDQVATALELEVLPVGEERLGVVAGALLQRMPDGSTTDFTALQERLHRDAPLLSELTRDPSLSAEALAAAVAAPHSVEILSTREVWFRCRCSQDRVTQALAALEVSVLEDMLSKEGKAVVTCEFCAERYTLDADALRALIAGAADEKN